MFHLKNNLFFTCSGGGWHIHPLRTHVRAFVANVFCHLRFRFFSAFPRLPTPRSVFPPLFPSCFGHRVGEFMYCRYGICCGCSRPGYFRCPFFGCRFLFFCSFRQIFLVFFALERRCFSLIDSIDCFFLLTRINRSLPRKQSGCEDFFVSGKKIVFFWLKFREQILKGCFVFFMNHSMCFGYYIRVNIVKR